MRDTIPSIIGFAGRKESGKSELAKICTEYGYERISFANPLKDIVAALISGTKDDVNRYKYANWNLQLKQMDLTYIAQETQIPIKIVRETLEHITFHNTREMLQIIGTDLIRKYNPNWHVERTIDYINNSECDKFVIDDVRFPNERAAIEERGGNVWFIVRPYLSNISNHESETSLKWQDFDNLIITNKGVEYLKLNWCLFMENGYEDSLIARNNIMYKIYGNKDLIDTISKDTNQFTVLDNLFITKYEFTYNAQYLEVNDEIQIESIIDAPHGNHYILIKKGDATEVISHPLIIEDLKKYIN